MQPRSLRLVPPGAQRRRSLTPHGYARRGETATGQVTAQGQDEPHDHSISRSPGAAPESSAMRWAGTLRCHPRNAPIPGHEFAEGYGYQEGAVVTASRPELSTPSPKLPTATHVPAEVHETLVSWAVCAPNGAAIGVAWLHVPPVSITAKG